MADNFMDFKLTTPIPAELEKDLKKMMHRPTPMLIGLRTSRNRFWKILSRRYLRARSRSDKKRLMRDTGTTVQSYFPSESDTKGNLHAAVDSDYEVAKKHEDRSSGRVMIIKPVRARALFIPLGLRSVSRGILPSTSGAGEGGLKAGTDFVFRKSAKVTRRWPSHWALKSHKKGILKRGHDEYIHEMVARWDKLGPVKTG